MRVAADFGAPARLGGKPFRERRRDGSPYRRRRFGNCIEIVARQADDDAVANGAHGCRAETAGEEGSTEEVPTPAPGLDLEDDLNSDLDRDLEREPMGEPGEEAGDTTDAGLDGDIGETAEDSDGGSDGEPSSSLGWKPASLLK